MPRHAWLSVDGVLLLDKPPAISSNDALQRVRRAYRARKAGHGGTLDPLATGLLPLAFGHATRFLHDLVNADKEYTASVRLGAISSTGDAEGQLTATPGHHPGVPDRQRVLAALAALTGPIMQRAPMYSALKHQGRPLYEYARAGITIERPDRAVTIHSLDLIELGLDRLRVRVRCSKGTYIRVLAEDIGAALGTGAWLEGLRRDAVGQFTLARAHSLADIDAGRSERSDDHPHRGLPALEPVDTMVSSLPTACLDADAARRFVHGQAIAMPELAAVLDLAREPLRESGIRHEVATVLLQDGYATTTRCRVYAADRFLGLGRFDGPMLNPERVLPESPPA